MRQYLFLATLCGILFAACSKKEHGVAKEDTQTKAFLFCGVGKKGERYTEFNEKLSKRLSSFSEIRSEAPPAPAPITIMVPVVIYLDFDGEHVEGTLWNWSGQESFDCPASTLSVAQQQQIEKSVAEHFAGLNIIVTRELWRFLASPTNRRMRVIVTHSMGAIFPPAAGYAFINSISGSTESPVFTFEDWLVSDVSNIAKTCSHEFAHTVGLYHQSLYDQNCALVYQYLPVFQLGHPLSWSATMGSYFGSNVTGWYKGQTDQGCATYQDDFVQLANYAGIFPDDVPNTLADAKPLPVGTVFDALINDSTDTDVFIVTPEQGRIGTGISVVSKGGVDITISVVNKTTGELIATYDDTDALNITQKKVFAGPIYIKVSTSTQPGSPIPARMTSGGYTIKVTKTF